MKIYWYWPFAREEEADLIAAVQRPGDRLIVQTLARHNGLSPTSDPRCRIVADLPEVPAARAHSPRWLYTRVDTYLGRRTARRLLEVPFAPDVSHVMFLNYFTDIAPSPRMTPASTRLSTVHDVVPHQRRLPDRVQRRVLKRLYHVSGHLVVNHEHVRRRLCEEFEVSEECVSVVPPQVPDFGHNARLPLPTEKTVLFFGTMRANKGIDVLLEAIEILRDRRDLRFVIAGRGESRLEERVVVASRHDSRVHAEIGWISPQRKSELLSAARLVVLPYTSFASQSGVLHDSYGHGRPLLVTDVGALGDTVREDGTGSVVPPSDAKALAEAIDRALADDISLAEQHLAAMSMALARSPEVVGNQLRELYGRLLG